MRAVFTVALAVALATCGDDSEDCDAAPECIALGERVCECCPDADGCADADARCDAARDADAELGADECERARDAISCDDLEQAFSDRGEDC